MVKVGEAVVEVDTVVAKKPLEKSLNRLESRFKKFQQRVKKVVFNPLTLAAAATTAVIAGGFKKMNAEFEKGSSALDNILAKMDDLATLTGDIGATEIGTRALTEALQIRGIQDPASFIKSFQQVVADNPALKGQFEQAGVVGTGNQLLTLLKSLSNIEDPQERARKAKQFGLDPKQIGELTTKTEEGNLSFLDLFDKQLKELQKAGFQEGVAGRVGGLQEQQAIETVRRERELLIEASKTIDEGTIKAQASVLSERQNAEIRAVENLKTNAEAALAVAKASNAAESAFQQLANLIVEKVIPAITSLIGKLAKFGELIANPFNIFGRK